MADQPSKRRADDDSSESSAAVDSSSTTPLPHTISEGPSPAASLQSVTAATPSSVSSSSASSSSPSSRQTTSQAKSSTALSSAGQSQEISGKKHEPTVSSPRSSLAALDKQTGAIPKKGKPGSGKGPQSRSKRPSLSTKSSTADPFVLSFYDGKEESSCSRKSERSSTKSDRPGVSPEKRPDFPTYDISTFVNLAATAGVVVRWEAAAETAVKLEAFVGAAARIAAKSGAAARVAAESGAAARVAAESGAAARVAAESGAAVRVAAESGCVARVATESGCAARVAAESGCAARVAAESGVAARVAAESGVAARVAAESGVAARLSAKLKDVIKLAEAWKAATRISADSEVVESVSAKFKAAVRVSTEKEAAKRVAAQSRAAARVASELEAVARVASELKVLARAAAKFKAAAELEAAAGSTADLKVAAELEASALAAKELEASSELDASALTASDLEASAELEASAGAAAELETAAGAAPQDEYDDEEGEGLRMVLTSSESRSGTLRGQIKITEIKTDFPQYWKISYVKHPPEKTKKGRKLKVRKFFFPVPDEKVRGRAQSSIMVDNIYIKRDLKLNGIEFITLWEEDDAVNISLNILKESFIAASVPAPQLPQVGSTSTGRVCSSLSGKADCALQMHSAYMDIITYYIYYFLHKAQDMRPLTNPIPGDMMIYANYGTMKFFRVRVKWSEKDAEEFKTAAEIATGPKKVVKDPVEVPEPDDDVFEEEDSRKAEEEKEVEEGDGGDDGSDDNSDSHKVDEIKLPVECVDYCTEMMAEVVNLYEFVGRDLLPLKSIPPQALKATVHQINDTKRNISSNIQQRVGKLVRVTTAATVEGIEDELTRVVLHDAGFTRKWKS